MTRILGFHILGIPLIAWSISIPFLAYTVFEFLFWRWRVKERRLDSTARASDKDYMDRELRSWGFVVPAAAFFAFSARAEARYLHPGEPSRPMPPALNAFLLLVTALGVGLLLWALFSYFRDELEVRRQARALERFRRVNGKRCDDGGRG